MPATYRATQKTVKALELIVKYIDSAISRCDDDSAQAETKDTLPLLRALAVATLEVEAQTRRGVLAPEASVPAPAAPEAPATPSGEATDEADAIAQQAAALAAAVDARLEAAA